MTDADKTRPVPLPEMPTAPHGEPSPVPEHVTDPPMRTRPAMVPPRVRHPASPFGIERKGK